ncbi:G-box-binding factor 3-like [Iris pallida]|uniref:G-box-binding factor 3-like n=1 Tax=Iris pallida TaxID=29817 RepID=A0AAX6EXV0_IRIPA|nr:G-box-binding factor 3-like [Iris pallida]
MGNDEAAAPSKSDKASSPAQEQVAVHPYPDWAAMQAYYGPGVPLPPPYFSTTVAPGHPPYPYMWGPQPLIQPFGTPFSAIYPHGVYSHPSVSLVASPSTTDLPAKSSSNKGKGLMKKLKGFDGLAVSTINVNAEIAVASSQSGENVAEGSSDCSDDNNELGGKETQRKRSSKDTPMSGNKKAGELVNADHDGELKVAPKSSSGVTMPPSTIIGKPIGMIPASSLTPPVDFRAPNANQAKAGVHAEPWGQDDKEIKREKRKQSNRESARRSRLRKQVETEELATKVESLTAENTNLRHEIGRLKENSEKLKAENSTLTEKLKNAGKLENQEAPSIVVENFLSKIDKYREEEAHENSGAGKLQQLLDSSQRTDAVAAG